MKLKNPKTYIINIYGYKLAWNEEKQFYMKCGTATHYTFEELVEQRLIKNQDLLEKYPAPKQDFMDGDGDTWIYDPHTEDYTSPRIMTSRPYFYVVNHWGLAVAKTKNKPNNPHQGDVEHCANTPTYYDLHGSKDVTELAHKLRLTPAGFNTLKYLIRAGHKPGEPRLKDLNKALASLQREIKWWQNPE